MPAQFGQFFFSLANEAVADFGDALQVAFALFGLLFNFQLFDLLLEGADAGDEIFFFFPVGLQGVGLLANLGELFLDHREPFPRVGVVFVFQGLLFDFQLHGFALELIDVGGQRIDLDTQRGGCFVDQVDRLVGQKTVGDVAVREGGCGDDGRVFDAHAVMHLVFLLQAAKDGDGVFDIGFANENNLETALESRIFFDVLAVFV